MIVNIEGHRSFLVLLAFPRLLLNLGGANTAGLRFALREGGKTVGAGVVSKVLS
jgi:translation elongation factor EF-1alpha